MVAGRSRQAEGRLVAFLENGVHRAKRRSGGKQGGVVRVMADHRVAGVHEVPPREAGFLDVLPVLPAVDLLDPADLCGLRALPVHQFRERRLLKRALDRRQPLGPFGVAGSGVMQ